MALDDAAGEPVADFDRWLGALAVADEAGIDFASSDDVEGVRVG